MITSKSYLDEGGNTVRVSFHGSLTTAEVITADGIRARGHSKLHDEDTYNKHFGEILATTRAVVRALQKTEKRLARQGAS